MKPEHLQAAQKAAHITIIWLGETFDKVANWVVQLTWKRFLVYALLALIGGSILQNTLFSSHSETSGPSRHKAKRVIIDEVERGKEGINIDEDGIHIHKRKKANRTPPIAPTPPMAPPTPPSVPAITTPPVSATATLPETGKPADKATEDALKAAATATQAAKDATAALNEAMKKITEQAEKAAEDAADEAHDAAQEAADIAAAEQEAAMSRKESSKWFSNFVLLLILALLGTKALMGGKKRAEVQAEAATAAAEQASLQRQVSEAKMQMMQAQVEPHFLFNTLASVEYLIETDPPRAAAMQRSLIKYLRAVLPQMRETALVTTLGREADIVKAYLDLLKMRMEERLSVDFQIPDDLRNAAFPPMMLQSLVENAIKHGLECKPEGGTLKVLAEVAQGKLRVCVTDNGLGFGAVASDSTGLGLPSIRERLKLLHGDQAQLIIEPNTPSGVITIIEVPYQVTN